MEAVLAKPPPRDAILDVAEPLFARHGFAGVGLAEVANVAGRQKSSLFHHFRSKADLYAAVVGRALVHIEVRLTHALATGSDPLQRLDRVVDALIDALAEHPTYSRLLLRLLFEDERASPATSEPGAVRETVRRITSLLTALLHDGIAAGALRPASVAHTLQTLIGVTVYHFASSPFGDELLRRSVFSPAEVRRRKREVRALLHRGIAAAPATLSRPVRPPGPPSKRPDRAPVTE
jgi:TetR/AcrR family transcriptional regulator